MLCPKKFVSDTLKIALSSGQRRKPRSCGGAFRGSERAAATPQRASQMVLVVKNPPANAEDIRDEGSIPGSRRSPGGGHDNPLQYSCLGESHGQKCLAGYSPYCRTESDTTEATQHSHTGRWRWTGVGQKVRRYVEWPSQQT